MGAPSGPGGPVSTAAAARYGAAHAGAVLQAVDQNCDGVPGSPQTRRPVGVDGERVHAAALVAVLAGIAFKVGLDIIDWGFLKRAHRLSGKGALITYGVIALTVFVDLIAAVGIGLFVANVMTVMLLLLLVLLLLLLLLLMIRYCNYRCCCCCQQQCH